MTLLRALTVVLAVLLPATGFADCAYDRVDVRGDWGQATFKVAVAASHRDRQRGLMFVPKMDKWAGMLFIFDEPHHARFWMKNTLIPLDMLFVTPEGIIQTVHDSAIPGDLTGIEGGPGILYVFEINGGLSKQLGLKAGSQLRHPSIDPAKASWPCE